MPIRPLLYAATAARFGRRGLLFVLCSAAPVLARGAELRDASHADFRRNVAALQATVRGCRASASACGASVGPDDRVAAEGSAPKFTQSWDWLRGALEKAGKAPEAERQSLMGSAAAHLEALAAESDAALDPATKARTDGIYSAARKEADAILSKPAFQHNDGPTWWDRMKARLVMWIARIFEGVGRVGEAAPWLGTLLEWLFFTAAAAGLLLFIRRSFVRQRLAIALNQSTGQISAWDRESSDWARDAETHAAAREWREAVHCLYWAAIVKLEARRAWRHNPARTPREYVRLLKAGSAQQGELRGLTGIFERVWYGLRDAEDTDYQKARDLFDRLTTAAAETPEVAQ